MLVRLWAVPTQRYSQYGKSCWFSRSHRSTIIRLPSGAHALYVDPVHFENRRKLVACTDCEQSLAFRHCFAHCYKGGALFCKWIGNAGHQPLPCALPISGIHCPTRLTRRTRPTGSLQVAKLRALPLAFRLTLKREALGQAQECARTEQARRRFAARPKMGLCASCREAPAVVQRFGCQRSNEAARRLGADWRFCSNLASPPITCPLIFQARVLRGVGNS